MALRILCAALFAVLFVQSAGAQEPQPDSPAFRALWVTRWDYVNESDVRATIAGAAGLGTTDVIWQVRGQADAHYGSDLEPWGEHALRDVGISPETLENGPGFDPLAVAVEEAHARGMKLHAWINVMPLWRGTEPPKNPKHAWHTKPHLRLKDLDGQDQPLNDHYVIINPVLDGAHDMVVAAVRDIVTRYDVDGIHMDYVRFVSDTMDKTKFYPGDAESLALYTVQTGRTFVDDAEGRTLYRDWVRERITHLVRRIRKEGVSLREGTLLTAAVWRRPDLARDQYLQDAAQWTRDGLLDLAMPMIYADDDERFSSDLAAWQAEGLGDRVIPGIGAYKHPDGGQTVRQIELCPDPRRYVLFAYPWFNDSRSHEADNTPAGIKARESRRTHVQRFVRDHP